MLWDVTALPFQAHANYGTIICVDMHCPYKLYFNINAKKGHSTNYTHTLPPATTSAERISNDILYNKDLDLIKLKVLRLLEKLYCRI